MGGGETGRKERVGREEEMEGGVGGSIENGGSRTSKRVEIKEGS